MRCRKGCGLETNDPIKLSYHELACRHVPAPPPPPDTLSDEEAARIHADINRQIAVLRGNRAEFRRFMAQFAAC